MNLRDPKIILEPSDFFQLGKFRNVGFFSNRIRIPKRPLYVLRGTSLTSHSHLHPVIFCYSSFWRYSSKARFGTASISLLLRTPEISRAKYWLFHLLFSAACFSFLCASNLRKLCALSSRCPCLCPFMQFFSPIRDARCSLLCRRRSCVARCFSLS